MRPALCLLALLAGGSVSAQTGGLRVVVTDAASKVPLPGVEVVLTSADRHVAATSARTNPGGAVEFPVLRPAGYTIEVRLAGYAPLSLSDVRVPAGGVAVLPIALFPEMQESLQVDAVREGVDLDDTTTSATFSAEFTEHLPLYGRFYQTLLTLAPGVLDTDQDGNPNVLGARESDFRTQVGGIANTDPLTGGFLSYINLESVDALQVIPAGAGVEYGRAQGGFASIVQKQGGNTFEGVTGLLFGGDLLDGNGASGGETEDPEFNRFQPFIQVSGPIVRDRLWYRLSHEFITREDPISVGGEVVVTKLRQGIHSDQLTWQVTPRNKLALQLQSDPQRSENVGVGPNVAAESSHTIERGGRTGSLTWTAPYSAHLFAEGVAAYQDHTEDVFPTVTGARNECGAYSRRSKLSLAHCTVADTGEVSGSWPVDSRDHRQRFTVRGQVTFSPTTRTVGHQLKAGIAVENERYFRTLMRGIEGRVDVERPDRYPFSQGIYYTEMRVPGTMDSRAVGSGTTAFLEDQIRFGSRVTLTAGVRMDREEIASESKEAMVPAAEVARYRALVEEGFPAREAMEMAFTGFDSIGDFGEGLADVLGIPSPPISSLLQMATNWPRKRRLANIDIGNTTFSPRVAVAWDPWGTGKTKIAATAGRYYDKVFLSVPLLGSEPAVTSLNFNVQGRHGGGFSIVNSRGGAENARVTVVDPGLRTPYQDEYTLSFERELLPETSLKVTGVRRRFRDQLQDVDINHVPGDTGKCLATFDLRQQPIVGSPGSGQRLVDPYTGLLYTDTDPGLGDGRIDDCLGRIDKVPGSYPFRFAHYPDALPDLYPLNPVWGQVMVVTNANTADYSAAIVQLVRRHARGWEMQANYTWSRALGDAEQFDQLLGDDPAPMAEERGFLSYDQRHVVKVAASLDTRRQWRLGTAVRWESGLPYSVLESVPSYYGHSPEYGFALPQPQFRDRYVTGQRNDQRNPSFWTLDARAAREYGLSKGRVFGLTLEGFNLLNDDTLQILEIRGQVATSIRRFGRRLQVGLRYAF